MRKRTAKVFYPDSGVLVDVINISRDDLVPVDCLRLYPGTSFWKTLGPGCLGCTAGEGECLFAFARIVREITHPQSGLPVSGFVLGQGNVVQKGDMYSSLESSEWEDCPEECFGKTLGEPSGVLFVRPAIVSSFK